MTIYEGPERRRRSIWRTLYWWWHHLVPLAAITIAAFAVLGVHERAVEQEREVRERRHQTCLLFERNHETAVGRVSRTYAYLAQLPRSEYGLPLTRAIVRDLRRLEQEARMGGAPVFCDEPNVGLREPNPVLPEQRDFSHLLRRQ